MSRIAAAAAVLLAISAGACGDSHSVIDPPHRAECLEPATSPAAAPGIQAYALFTLLDDTPILTPGQVTQLAYVHALPSTARVVLARVAGGADSLLQVGRAIAVPVSPTLSYVVMGQQADRRASGETFWTGSIPGQNGGSVILLGTMGLNGDLRSYPTGGRPVSYSFIPLGGGLEAIVCMDPSLIPID